MEKIFVEVLKLSVTGGLMALAAAAVRPFLRKVPKSFSCFLWILVGVRLLLPFSVETSFGVIPGRDVMRERILEGMEGSGETAVLEPAQAGTGNGLDFGPKEDAVLKEAEHSFPEKTGARLFLRIGSAVWLTGMVLMLGYFVLSWVRLTRRVCTAVPDRYRIEDRGEITVYRCGGIEVPFLFGILRPGIYIPFDVEKEELPYILRHEMAHRRRMDHLVKPAAFLILSVYWFNPCIWLAYRLLCRDLELACDELVIRGLKAEDRKAYSRALLNCSVSGRGAGACPVAFGEFGVKGRISNILRYRKPTVLALALGVTVCCVLLFCFMTQRREEADSLSEDASAGQLTGQSADPGAVHGRAAIDQAAIGQAAIGQTAIDQGAELIETAASQLDEIKNNNNKIIKIYWTLEMWAEAFCDRDGQTILTMCSEEVLESMKEDQIIIEEEDSVAFGWSSPWPWDREEDYWLIRMTESYAEILYYAWVSDPHVTVWKEKLTYRPEGDVYVIESSELKFLDNLCSAEEFYEAYPEGDINGTPMDYLQNGAGEALNENAKANRDSEVYGRLFAPDTAAVSLLNLLNNEDKIEITTQEDDEGVRLSIYFRTGGGPDEHVYVRMIQPYGEDGIWIPQTLENA